MDKPPKRPRDPSQLAKSIIDIATGEKPVGKSLPPKQPVKVQREAAKRSKARNTSK